MADNSNTPATTSKAAPATVDKETIEKLVLAGDLSKMDGATRVQYYLQLCASLKLNPHTQPFQILRLSGKEVMYATKSCTEQLRKLNGVSVTKLDTAQPAGLLVVTAYVKDKKGRTDASTGAVVLEGLKGEALANAYMKAETKAKRRATLSICGLGMLDESELDTLPTAQVVPMPDLDTSAEVVEAEVVTTPEPTPMKAVPAEAPAATPSLADQPTPTQVRRIKELLNHPTIADDERSKTLVAINKMDQQRAAECIGKLEKTINQRDEAKFPGGHAPATTPKVDTRPLSRHQREDLINLTNYPAITAEERSAYRLEIGKLNRTEAEQSKAALRDLIAERTPDKQAPAELAGEKFERVARELLAYTRKHQQLLGTEAYEDAYLHVQGLTVTAAELEASLQRHQEAVEALQAA